MRFLFAAFFTATATTALTEGDILARIEAVEAKNADMTAKYTAMKAENAEIKATLNATAAGELKMFNAEECPPGWVEFNKTQGYLLTGRPKGGETGMTINRPMDIGETGRSPEHSHEVGVEDLGHTHVMAVNDPGHSHDSPDWVDTAHYSSSSGSPRSGYAIKNHGSNRHPTTNTSQTGIVVDALIAKSNIQVSLTSNEDGEGYPLVYVLICQRELEG
jgi:hypothetical protein